MKRIIIISLLALGFAWNCRAQGSGWVYYQDSISTYCSSGASCSFHFDDGNFFKTASQPSVWVLSFAIRPNTVTVTNVSGGGGTWVHCANCQLGVSALGQGQDAWYNLSGTTNNTAAITATLSGTATSLSPTWTEIILPAGASSASLDFSASTSNTSCTTCTGIAVTTTGTDAVMQIMTDGGGGAWNAYSAPYITDYESGGFIMNSSVGSIAAPSIHMRATNTGYIGMVLAFKSSYGTFTPTAPQYSLVNSANSGSAGLNCSSAGCTMSLNNGNTSGTPGSPHLLFLVEDTTSAGHITSVTDSSGEAWVVPSQCAVTGGLGNATISCAYALSNTSSSVSSLTIKTSNASVASANFQFEEIASTSGGAWSLAPGTTPVASSVQAAGSFNATAQALTLTGSAPIVIFQTIDAQGGVSSSTWMPQPHTGISGATGEFRPGNGSSNVFLNALPSSPTPIWANEQKDANVINGAAFISATAGGPPPPINAATCGNADVAAALSSVAADGTVVNIPAGSCTWNSPVTYNQSFSTTIQCAGNATGSDSLGNPTGYNDQTSIFDTVSPGSTATFTINTALGKSLRMTGCSFLNNAGQTQRDIGVIAVTGNSHSVRLDHNHFLGGICCRMLNVSSGNVWGVIDHNYFNVTNGVNVNLIEVNGANWGGAGDGNGHRSWNDLAYYGTEKFLIIENNAFNSTASGNSSSHAIDTQQGGRSVFRYNTLTNAEMQTHGIGHGASDRGPRALEVYGNVVTQATQFTSFLEMLEGGSMLWWGNTVTSNYNNMIEGDDVRTNTSTYTQSAPPGGWGQCGISGGSAWDLNTAGTRCMDGIGNGKGDLLQGSLPSVCDASTTDCTNSVFTGRWPTQALEPVYLWGNGYSGNQWLAFGGDATTTQNRDYYLDSGASFTGTTGVGCGPASGVGCTNPVAQPATCTAGVGYWKPASNTLYQCAAGNVWNPIYTSYTYPAPLAASLAWGAMDAWLPMNSAAAGSTITPTILTNGTTGNMFTWSTCVGSGACSNTTSGQFTLSTSQGDMGGSVTVNGTTYPVGTTTQAITVGSGTNFTYANGLGFPGGKSQMVFNGFITFGTSPTNVLDIVYVADGSGNWTTIQETNSGTVWLEGSPTNHSATIPVVDGKRYAFSFYANYSAGTSQLAIFDPQNNYSQVGTTVTATIPVGGSIGQVHLGNAETGTTTSPIYLEDVMFDWTNHKFPNFPQASGSISPPTVTTTVATNITMASASSGGTVTSNGGASVIAEGVCFSSTVDPPTSPCTSDGTATPFTSSLTGLSANLTYHYRAFAQNSAGISYGNDLSFSTSIAATPTFSLTPGNQIGPLAPVDVITSATGAAKICYTTNGLTPTAATQGTCDSATITATEKTLTNGGSVTLPVNATTVITAIATAVGLTNSPSASASYTVPNTAGFGLCNPPAGVYSGTQSVSCTNPSSAPVQCIVQLANGAPLLLANAPQTNGTNACTRGTLVTPVNGTFSVSPTAPATTIVITNGGTGFLDSPVHAQAYGSPTPIVLPTLPQATVDLTLPVQGVSTCPTLTTGSNCIRNVPAGDAANFQNALNAATCGDTIVLQAGSTYNSTLVSASNGFTIPATACTGWIEIVSSNLASLPTPGNRVGPSNASNMPIITATGANNPLFFAPSSNHWRLMGLKVTTSYTGTGTVFELLTMGLTTSGVQVNTLAQLPNQIILDRDWIFGATGNGTGGPTNVPIVHGVYADTQAFAMVDSYCEAIVDAGSDSQCVISIDGLGPYLIQNNFFSAAGEDIMFGGSPPRGVGDQHLASDITVVGNYFTKDFASWATPNSPTAVDVKNLFELKLGKRILLDGNVLDTMWESGQDEAIIIRSVSQSSNAGNAAPWVQVSDVTVTHNIIRHAPIGIVIAPSYYNLGVDGDFSVTLPTERVLIQNNLFNDMSSAACVPGPTPPCTKGWEYHITADSALPAYNWIIDHNTGFNDGAWGFVGDSGSLFNMQITNNLGVYGPNTAIPGGLAGNGSNQGTDAMTKFLPGVVWNDQVFTSATGACTGGASFCTYPTGTTTFPTQAAVQFTSISGTVPNFTGNFQVNQTTSPLHNAGTDGKDIGVWDWTCLNQETNAAIAGTYSQSCTVANPSASLTPAALAFANQGIGTASPSLTATLANTGSVPIGVTQTQMTGSTNFALTNLGSCFTNFGSGTNNAPFTLPVGQSCTFVITFSPANIQSYSGAFSVTSNAPSSPQVVNLTGQGVPPAAVPAMFTGILNGSGTLQGH